MNSGGVDAIINLKVNRCSRLMAVTLKKINNVQLGILRNIPTKFQLHPFSNFGRVVSTRFAFNRRSPLGAVSQKLSRYFVITILL